MCTNTKFYFSPPKYISNFHREKLFHTCKCGECAECKEQRRREWNFRIFHEFKSCIDSGGYVIMDMLSYSDENLPHLSDFVTDVDWSLYPELDYACFSRRDIQLYMKRLRDRLDGSRVRSFVACEYGTDDKYIDYYGRVRLGTHRPHYHQLLFVLDGKLSPLKVMQAVHDSWQKGITQIDDHRGLNYVLRKYVIRNVSLGAAYYVSKYVVKDSSFQATIDSRLSRLSIETCGFNAYQKFNSKTFTNDLVCSYDDSSVRSLPNKKRWRQIRSHVLQRVYPSEKFGAGFLDDCPLNNIIETGVVSIPDKRYGVRYMQCPMYYKRKLFYEKVKFNGDQFWILNDLGRRYRLFAEAREYMSVRQRLSAISYVYREIFDLDSLCHYVCHQRGRFRGSIINDLSFHDKIKLPNLWRCFTSEEDVARFGVPLVVMSRSLSDGPIQSNRLYRVSEFVRLYSYFDESKERLLRRLDHYVVPSAEDKDRVYYLRNLIKQKFRDARYNYTLDLFSCCID